MGFKAQYYRVLDLRSRYEFTIPIVPNPGVVLTILGIVPPAYLHIHIIQGVQGLHKGFVHIAIVHGDSNLRGRFPVEFSSFTIQGDSGLIDPHSRNGQTIFPVICRWLPIFTLHFYKQVLFI